MLFETSSNGSLSFSSLTYTWHLYDAFSSSLNTITFDYSTMKQFIYSSRKAYMKGLPSSLLKHWKRIYTLFHSWHTSDRQGHFSPSLPQNRAWDSHLTRLFSFSVKRILHIIELNSIILKLPCVVCLSANEWAEPFAPFPLQKLQHYYDSVRHSTTHRFPGDTLNPGLIGRLYSAS